MSQSAISSSKNVSLENLGGGEFLRKNNGTPPRGKPQRPVSASFQSSPVQSTKLSPIDDWEAKLFSKQSEYSVIVS